MAVAKKEESLLPKLIESNLALQKKFVELIGSFQEMTKKLDRMLTLFEEAGRKITEVEIDEDRVKILADKLEALLEQNKDIAKGLILLEKYVRVRGEYEESSFKPRNFPGV